MIAKNTVCLWFDKGAEEAARFYAATSRTVRCARFTRRRVTFREARRATC